MKDRAWSVFKLNLLTVFFLSLLLPAIYVLLVRLVGFYIVDYKPELETYLSQQLNKDVAINDIDTSWSGFDPIVDINGVSLDGRASAYVGRIRLQLSFWDSLTQLSPAIKKILIEHSELSALQTEKGDWQLAGFSLVSGEEKSETIGEDELAFIENLFAKTNIYLSDFLLSIHNDKGFVRSLRVPTAALAYKNEKIYVNGSVLEKGSERTLLNFSLEGEGVLKSGALKSKLYVEARSSEFLAQLIKVYEWESISIDNIDGNARIWLDLTDLTITNVFGHLQVSHLDWRSGLGSSPPVSNLAVDFNYQLNDESQHLSLRNLSYQFGYLDCGKSDIEIDVGSDQVIASVTEIDLACANGIATSSNILASKLYDRLTVSDPKGKLGNAYFSSTTESDDFIFEAQLHGVTVGAFESTPSGGNINGYLQANSQGGYVSFDTTNMSLGFPTLFLEPWQIHKSQGFVNWNTAGEDVHVFSEGIRLRFADGSFVFGDFSLLINDDSKEDYIHLAIAMQDIPFEEVPDFVPCYEVGADLYHWLTDALKAGSVSTGIFVGHGSVEGDSTQNSFTSSIQIETSQGRLRFEEEWPALEQLDASISLQNSNLLVLAESAKVADSYLQDVRAILKESSEGSEPLLQVTSQTKVDPQQIRFWLEESPLKQFTAEVSKQLQFDGEINVDIDLGIPVSEQGELSYHVVSHLNGSNIHHLDSDMNFESIVGQLEVSSSNGVYSKKLDLSVFGYEASMNVFTEFDPKTHDQFVDFETNDFAQLSKTVFVLNGRSDVAKVFEFFGYESTAFMSGSFAYEAQLALPNHDRSFPVLDVRSTLAGVTRSWPEPFAKSSDVTENLNVKVLLKPSQTFIGANLEDGKQNESSAELLFVNGDLTFGEVLVNDIELNEPNLSGINIAANLNRVDVPEWISFVDSLQRLPWDKNTKHENEIADSDVSVNKPTDEQSLSSGEMSQHLGDDDLDENAYADSLIKNVELNIAHAFYDDNIFKDTLANIKQDDGRWVVMLEGDDIDGMIGLPEDDVPLSLEFNRLRLTASDNKDENNGLDIDSVPEFDFDAKEFLINDKSYGAISLNARKLDSKVIFRDIQLDALGTRTIGQISWESISENEYLSILTGESNGSDIAKVFSLLDLDPLFSSDRYSAKFGVTWPGDPLSFALERLSGKFELSAHDGFLNTDDKDTGILRLFGILNAEAITRRLKLDFSDLYKSGVGFDSFSFNASMDQGLLTLSDPLKIEGPAGDYTINGYTDLASQSLNMDMLVELPFSQNVPLAALVLGAPQIGGLVWVADKLLGEPLSALTTSRYDISGTWDKPIIELKEAVNAKSKKDNGSGQIERVSPKLKSQENPDQSITPDPSKDLEVDNLNSKQDETTLQEEVSDVGRKLPSKSSQSSSKSASSNTEAQSIAVE